MNSAGRPSALQGRNHSTSSAKALHCGGINFAGRPSALQGRVHSTNVSGGWRKNGLAGVAAERIADQDQHILLSSQLATISQ